MMSRTVRFVTVTVCLVGGFSHLPAQLKAGTPDNLAYQAKVSATSEYNGHHLATFAVDGKIPAPDCKNDTLAAWCIRKASVGDQGKFFFEWPQPIEVVEVVYFARMAMLRNESRKDYEA